jgi:hypothetical protein
MWYSSSCGRIELNIPRRIYNVLNKPGRADDDVEYIRKHEPTIERQLLKVDPELLREELRGYGAWNDDELQDHNVNLARLLWLACWDLIEEETQRGR